MRGRILIANRLGTKFKNKTSIWSLNKFINVWDKPITQHVPTAGLWRTETVNVILTDIVYCGHMENHKYEVSNYKTKKLVRVPDNEHIIVRNTHEAIINEEDFEIVNNMIKSRISPRIHESENLFKSIVYCAHCGNRMVLTHQARNSNYVSQTYKCHKHNRDIDLCPELNTILYSELKKVALEDLRS